MHERGGVTDAARGQGGDHLSIGSLIDYVISFGPTVPRDIDVHFQATLKKIARQCLIPSKVGILSYVNFLP